MELATTTIAEPEFDLVVYLHQDGRGVGLMAKLKAYALQDQGLDTIEANEARGFAPDCRAFNLAVAVLNELKVRQVRLMSNNPQNVEALTKGGFEVIELIACPAQPSPYALSYLRTKKKQTGHSLTVV